MVHAENSAIIDTLTNVGADNQTATTYGTDVLSDIISAVVDDLQVHHQVGHAGFGAGQRAADAGRSRPDRDARGQSRRRLIRNINIVAGDRVMKDGARLPL